jgi:hypothetical protein
MTLGVVSFLGRPLPHWLSGHIGDEDPGGADLDEAAEPRRPTLKKVRTVVPLRPPVEYDTEQISLRTQKGPVNRRR